MGRVSIQIEGVEALKEMLGDVAPNEARNITRSAVNKLAGIVRDELKRTVTVRTHALQKSIRVVRRRGGKDSPVSDVRGGGGAPYMLMLEFGTSRTKAQPFIVPSAERLRPSVPRFYTEEVGKALERTLARKAKKAA